MSLNPAIIFGLLPPLLGITFLILEFNTDALISIVVDRFGPLILLIIGGLLLGEIFLTPLIPGSNSSKKTNPIFIW